MAYQPPERNGVIKKLKMLPVSLRNSWVCIWGHLLWSRPPQKKIQDIKIYTVFFQIYNLIHIYLIGCYVLSCLHILCIYILCVYICYVNIYIYIYGYILHENHHLKHTRVFSNPWRPSQWRPTMRWVLQVLQRCKTGGLRWWWRDGHCGKATKKASQFEIWFGCFQK